MKTFFLFIWTFFCAAITSVFAVPKRVSSNLFASLFRVVGLGLGRTGVQETRALVSLGRFRTADSISNNSIPSPQAYTFQAPAGVPGDITRVDESSVEPAQLIAIASVYVQSFGVAMVYASGGISQVGAGFAAADFAGVLVRQAPGIGDSLSSDSSTGGGIPNAVQIQGLLVRGYVNVLCVYGTPVRGGVVYVRSVSTSNNTQLGTFDATSDSSNNVALSLTQATWATDGKDANNNCELRVYR